MERGQDEQEQEHIAIIVAGCPKSGKSKALNNLFHLDFDSSISAVAVTRHIKVKRVVKNGLHLIIVDTPGLGAADLNMDQVKKEIEKAIGGLSFTVLYCHSVGPNSKDEDQVVLKNLQKTLGKKVWEKCVFLFTFSDQLRSEHYPTNAQWDEYIRILQSHAQKLSSILQHHCGRDALNIRLVMDVGEDENYALNEIVAVPVGVQFKNEKEKHKLLRRERADDWRDCAVLEILRKSTPLEQYKLLSMMHGKVAVSTAVAGGTLGVLLGGIGGALVGLIAGGIGAIPGAVVGVVAGGVGGGMGGAAMSRTVLQNHREAQIAKMERLKEGEYVNVDPEQPPEDRVEDRDRPIQSPPIPIPENPQQQQQHVGETPSTMPTPQLASTIPFVRSYDPREVPKD